MDHPKDLEKIEKFERKLAELLTPNNYEFRHAYTLFKKWTPEAGWIIYPKGKPWTRHVHVWSFRSIKTFGRYFPLISWSISDILKELDSGVFVFINGYHYTH